MNRRHLRRKWATESKKNPSSTSIAVTVISVAAIIFFIICIVMAISSGGEVPRIVGALGMIFFLATIPCVVLARRTFKMNNYNMISRVVGLVSSIVAIVCWGLLYLFGLIFA